MYHLPTPLLGVKFCSLLERLALGNGQIYAKTNTNEQKTIAFAHHMYIRFSSCEVQHLTMA